MQPDDFEFYNSWIPPPLTDDEDGFDNLPSGLPHIETLRSQGLYMKQAYTASAKCGTSRYSTITGKNPTRAASSRKSGSVRNIPVMPITIPSTKLTDIPDIVDGQDCSSNNMAAMLKNHGGYRTGMVGKWHLTKFNDGEFQYTYEGSKAEVKACGFEYAEAIYAENLVGYWYEAEGYNFTHNMEYVVKKAIDFIENTTADDDRPFFLYLNPTAPHASGNINRALNTSCALTPEGVLTEEEFADIPEMTAKYGGSCESYRQSIRDRAGLNTQRILGSIWVDDAVGAILSTLESTGQLDNTIFLWQLDHGQEVKSSMYEGGTRIPQFIHYPNGGFSDGFVFDGMVGTVDIAPTMYEYANISSDLIYGMDGKSWKSAIENFVVDETSYNKTEWFDERCLYFELEEDRAVRCGCYKFLQAYNGSNLERGSIGLIASRKGLFYDDTALFNLCRPDGTYQEGPKASFNREKNGTEISFEDNPDVYEEMARVMECYINGSVPWANPDYEYGCNPIPPNDGQGGGGGSNFVTCSDTAVRYQYPALEDYESNASCATAMEFRPDADLRVESIYPDDFVSSTGVDVLNQRKSYKCPSLQMRIMEANGIPDHNIVLSNPNRPCAQNYLYKTPLVPTMGDVIRETSPSGVIGYALNGVPCFAAQENEGASAVEPLGNFESVEWYGHSGGRKNWHYHSAEFGLTPDLESIPYNKILGYAMDGFPIYGPILDDSVLDVCGGYSPDGTVASYRYHVRFLNQINQTLPYCKDPPTADTNWGYIIGCYSGAFDAVPNIGFADSSVETIDPTVCFPLTSIHGTVMEDLDAGSNGDTAAVGVIVSLLLNDGSGTIVQTSTTDEYGNYYFGDNLDEVTNENPSFEPGTYTVQILQEGVTTVPSEHTVTIVEGDTVVVESFVATTVADPCPQDSSRFRYYDSNSDTCSKQQNTCNTDTHKGVRKRGCGCACRVKNKTCRKGDLSSVVDWASQDGSSEVCIEFNSILQNAPNAQAAQDELCSAFPSTVPFYNEHCGCGCRVDCPKEKHQYKYKYKNPAKHGEDIHLKCEEQEIVCRGKKELFAIPKCGCGCYRPS